MSDDQEHWLRTDEIEEFIDALEHSALITGQLDENLRAWKWLIIALHSALQGACVCALRGHDTAGVSVLTTKSWKQVWHWLDVESRKTTHKPPPPEQLASLLELFSRVRDPNLLPAPHTLIASPEIVADVEMLNRRRNDFIHFVPRGWSLELSGLPRMVSNVSDAIEHLAVLHPSFWHHLGEARRDRIAKALATLRKRAANGWPGQAGP